MDAWLKVVIAIVPVLLAGVVTIAWGNARDLSLLAQEYRDIQAEQQHQRVLLEQRLGKCVREASKGWRWIFPNKHATLRRVGLTSRWLRSRCGARRGRGDDGAGDWSAVNTTRRDCVSPNGGGHSECRWVHQWAGRLTASYSSTCP